jgi:beta-glucosidase
VGDAVAEFVLNDTRVKLNDFIPSGLKDEWIIKITGKLTVEKSMPFELGLAVAGALTCPFKLTDFADFLKGRAKLFIDGKLTIDNWTSQTPGDFFYG